MSAWTQLLRLPVVSFVYGLEFMVQSLRAMQQTAQQVAGTFGPFMPIGAAPRGGATTPFKETREMSNCGCGDQCGKPFCEVRIYEYYIVSVRPCKEKVLSSPTTIVVTSDMNNEAFISYAIAMYCRQNPGLSEEDAKYLRVCHRLSCTFPKERESCSHGHEQTEILRQIRDAIGGQAAA